MIYYNQRNYPAVDYSYNGNGKKLPESGCGPTSASMAVENLKLGKMPPPDMAAFSKANGARESTGTNTNTLLKALCKKFPNLVMTTTTNFDTMVKHLQSGGFAIASTAGNRSGYTGLLSDSPHIFCVAGIRTDGRVETLDPAYYAGKYDKAGRKGKMTMSGNIGLCAQATLKTEINGRTMYLLSKKEEEPDLTKTDTQKLIDASIKKALAGDGVIPDWAKKEQVLEKAKAYGISDGTDATKLISRVEAMAMAVRAYEKAKGIK